MTKPITVAVIESDPQYAHEEPDGTEYDHYDFTFTKENFERIRLGYACLRCWESQPIVAYALAPDAMEQHLPGCPYTGDGIRRRQREDIAAEFYGEKWVGPTKRLEERIAEDDERRRKYRMDTGKDAGITVPLWVKL